MSTRFKTNSTQKHGQSPLPSGYENVAGIPELSMPSCGIEDVDVAVFDLFDKEIAPEYVGSGSKTLTKVPVVFAAGEKWALLKKGRPIRDRNNSLIIPLITVMRTELNQSMSEDVAGRGINQQSGEIVIRRRLDKSDRNYQALINRLFLKNQDNVAVRPTDPTLPGQPTTTRGVGELHNTAAVRAGALLTPNALNNVYETIVVPAPQFYTAKYQVTVWTQYTQHANQILEKIFSTFLPQAQSWRVDTKKGYWFVAKFDDGGLTSENNFDDMSTAERFIKYTFGITVPAYFFVSSAPGVPVPIKRYVSSPGGVTFDTNVPDNRPKYQYALGSDDPTLPLSDVKNSRADQQPIGLSSKNLYPNLPDEPTDFSDEATVAEYPGAASLPRGYPIKASRSAMGETVYTGAPLGGFEIVVSK